MNRVFLIILLPAILEVCRGCAVWTDRPLGEVLKQNEDSPWLVLVGDGANQPKIRIIGLSYGAIIHPEMVITSAIVSGTPTKNLVVFSNCRLSKEVNCDTSSVIEVMISPNIDRNNLKAEDFMLLLLMRPLTFSRTVNAVASASGDVDYDPDDCVIYHWQIVASKNGLKNIDFVEGIVNAEYRVSLNSANFGMSETEHSKLKGDYDCFLANCWNTLTTDFTSSTINFMGSPIVCKENDNKVMVGFSTYFFEMIKGEDVFKNVSLARGTLVKFSSDQDFIDQVVSALTSS